MFDDPKKELEKLEKQLLEDEEWFARELDSAKRMIGQMPERNNRPSAPRTPQAPKPAPKAQPTPKAQSRQKVTQKKKSKTRKKSNKGLLILAALETLGILGLAAYWVLVLLK